MNWLIWETLAIIVAVGSMVLVYIVYKFIDEFFYWVDAEDDYQEEIAAEGPEGG